MGELRNIAIRADASDTIGSGHVMRCLSLAGGLAASGARVRFLCRDLPPQFMVQICAEGHQVRLLRDVPESDESRDSEESISALQEQSVDWMIVDHYGLGKRWEASLRKAVPKLMVIDDLADREHDCDLLLDQNLRSGAEGLYRSLIPQTARSLLGPRYALLRPKFAQTSARDRSGPVRRILVFFGGADASNQTVKAVRAIGLLALPEVSVDIVVGPMFRSTDELENLCSMIPHARILRDADMAALMQGADLAIGAGGTTSWERCAVGLPTLAWPIADNQTIVLAELSKACAVYCPTLESLSTPEGVAHHLYALIGNPALRSATASAARSLCDGQGVRRVVIAMQASGLAVGASTEGDSRLMYDWRNHVSVRAVSMHTDPIAWVDHMRWFEASRDRADRVLLTGRVDDNPVGIVRFDRVTPDSAEVSIYLDPAKVGYGLGAALLDAAEAWISRHWPLQRISATVKAENIASHHLFRNAGYRQVSSAYEKAFN